VEETRLKDKKEECKAETMKNRERKKRRRGKRQPKEGTT
jgi:hypothetical protein